MTATDMRFQLRYELNSVGDKTLYPVSHRHKRKLGIERVQACTR